MKFVILSIALLRLIDSCDNSIRFDVPQPVSAKDCRTFDEDVQGSYWTTESPDWKIDTPYGFRDTTFLHVMKDKIIRFQTVDVLIPKRILDTSKAIVIERDSIHEFGDSRKYYFYMKNDTAHVQLNDLIPDTLFRSHPSTHLRKVGKIYYMNIPIDSVLWKVGVIGVRPDGYVGFGFFVKEDMEKAFPLIVGAMKDTAAARAAIKTTFNPSKELFQEIATKILLNKMVLNKVTR